MALTSSQSLWDFACAFYTAPRVGDICVRLQDDFGVNVCFLLCMRWLDTRGQSLSEQDFADLLSLLAPWTTSVIEPLRTLRRDLKLPIGPIEQDEAQVALRGLIKEAELLAEKKLLMALEARSQSMAWSSNPPANQRRYSELFPQAKALFNEFIAL